MSISVAKERWLPFLAPLGATFVLIGYLTTWLPHPTAGLTLIGLDISEWSKFLPQMQAGELPNRDWFYLPPITLALFLVLWSATWGNGRWQTWAARFLAIGISLLAFPAIEVIRFEAANQWQPRVIMIAAVMVMALLAAVLGRWPRVTAGLMVLAGLAGFILPTWAYWAVRPVISALVGAPIGIGIGVWLNLLGHLLMIGIAVVRWQSNGRESQIAAP